MKNITFSNSKKSYQNLPHLKSQIISTITNNPHIFNNTPPKFFLQSFPTSTLLSIISHFYT